MKYTDVFSDCPPNDVVIEEFKRKMNIDITTLSWRFNKEAVSEVVRKEFELAEIDAMSVGEVDFENCKILYNNLRSLSESQCSDERLWAGLCNGTFYDYMRKRYQYPTKQLKKKETDASAVISRFFFSGGTRSGFFRNGLAKC